MKLKLNLIVVVFCLFSCKKIEPNINQSKVAKIDSSRIAIIKYDSIDVTSKKIFPNGHNAILESADLKKIDKILNIIIDEQNLKQIVRFNEISAAYPKENYKLSDFIIKKNNYKQQYLAIQNSKGEKEVFINLFCNEIAAFPDWKKKLNYGGHGGGVCFFSFKINLYKNIYYDVWFNTEA